MQFFGFLNIDKPAGPTSHDIVARIRRLLPRKTKVGHAGTLDPFATGVLVVCVGGATRLAEYVREMPKEYRARIRLGATSTTGDSEGRIDTAEGVSPPAIESVRAAVDSFVGSIDQMPPAHSAVHVDGRRAYRLARDGRDVDIPPRTVRIDAIEICRYDYPALELLVRCGAGT